MCKRISNCNATLFSITYYVRTFVLHPPFHLFIFLCYIISTFFLLFPSLVLRLFGLPLGGLLLFFFYTIYIHFYISLVELYIRHSFADTRLTFHPRPENKTKHGSTKSTMHQKYITKWIKTFISLFLATFKSNARHQAIVAICKEWCCVYIRTVFYFIRC